jgi:hypothetical protein
LILCKCPKADERQNNDEDCVSQFHKPRNEVKTTLPWARTRPFSEDTTET